MSKMANGNDKKVFENLSPQAIEELHFVEATFGQPHLHDGKLTFKVKNFCIMEDNPINSTGLPLWVKNGVVECSGVVRSERVIVRHLYQDGKLEFGPAESVQDIQTQPCAGGGDPSGLIHFELEGRMENPPSGVLRWVISCSAVNLTLSDE